MKQKQALVPGSHLSDPQFRERLLSELERLFVEIEDGTVKDDTFSGCIALGNRNLPPLDLKQSEQITRALSRSPTAPDKADKGRIPILSSVFNLLRSLWEGQHTETHPERHRAGPTPTLLDKYGRVRAEDGSQTDEGADSRMERSGIQEREVKRFFSTQGEDYAWVSPYAWDLANRLNAVKRSEAEGDLALFFASRRKLCVRRPKSTRFEQAVQRYAAEISTLYCDDKGDVIDVKALEAFIRDLVDLLLNKTKRYWVTSPPIAIFDGLVATVIRPLLHRHQTAYYQGEMTGRDGVIASGSAKGRKTELVTVPKWNEKSRRLVERQLKMAFKAQVWSFLLDSFAPYNREYARSAHLDPAKLPNAGYLVRSFGDPVHLKQLMEMLQPTSQADDLAQHVLEHFRSDEMIDH